MKQAVIERMGALQIPPGIAAGGHLDHRVQRMTREVQIATHQPEMLRIFTVGLMVVFALTMLF